MGVTGERAALATPGRARWADGCKAVTDKPVLLGVGISNAEQAVEASRLRRRRGRRQRARWRACCTAAGPTAAHEFVGELRAALDRA